MLVCPQKRRISISWSGLPWQNDFEPFQLDQLIKSDGDKLAGTVSYFTSVKLERLMQYKTAIRSPNTFFIGCVIHGLDHLFIRILGRPEPVHPLLTEECGRWPLLRSSQCRFFLRLASRSLLLFVFQIIEIISFAGSMACHLHHIRPGAAHVDVTWPSEEETRPFGIRLHFFRFCFR